MTEHPTAPHLFVGKHSTVREKGHKPAGGEEVRLDAARLEVLEQLRQVPHQQPVQLKESGKMTNTRIWSQTTIEDKCGRRVTLVLSLLSLLSLLVVVVVVDCGGGSDGVRVVN